MLKILVLFLLTRSGRYGPDCVGAAAAAGTDSDGEAEWPPAGGATGMDGAAGGVGAAGEDRVVAGTDGLDGAAAERLQTEL
jgi:hypothetical protein